MFNARTKGPCITFPHEEHVLRTGVSYKGYTGRARAAHDETDTRAVEVLDALEDEAGGRRSELDDPERAEVKDVPLRRFGLGWWRESSEWPEDEAGWDLAGPDPGGVFGRLGRRKAGAGR